MAATPEPPPPPPPLVLESETALSPAALAAATGDAVVPTAFPESHAPSSEGEGAAAAVLQPPLFAAAAPAAATAATASAVAADVAVAGVVADGGGGGASSENDDDDGTSDDVVVRSDCSSDSYARARRRFTEDASARERRDNFTSRTFCGEARQSMQQICDGVQACVLGRGRAQRTTTPFCYVAFHW